MGSSKQTKILTEKGRSTENGSNGSQNQSKSNAEVRRMSNFINVERKATIKGTIGISQRMKRTVEKIMSHQISSVINVERKATIKGTIGISRRTTRTVEKILSRQKSKAV